MVAVVVRRWWAVVHRSRAAHRLFRTRACVEESEPVACVPVPIRVRVVDRNLVELPNLIRVGLGLGLGLGCRSSGSGVGVRVRVWVRVRVRVRVRSSFCGACPARRVRLSMSSSARGVSSDGMVASAACSTLGGTDTLSSTLRSLKGAPSACASSSDAPRKSTASTDSPVSPASTSSAVSSSAFASDANT
eukprot:scaffold78386_cov63-Phaeocystis_antarctica.AAC.8